MGKSMEQQTVERVWKIMNKETKEFSTGHFQPEWHKVGKVWTGEKYLKSHLTQFKKYWEQQSNLWGANDHQVKHYSEFYKNAVVIGYDLVESTRREVTV